MKKILSMSIITFVLVLAITGCGKSNNIDKEKIQEDNHSKIENNTNDTENGNEEDDKIITVDALYTDSSNISIFDEKISDIEISSELKSKIENENTKLFQFKINSENTLIDYVPMNEITVKSVYVGLADSNVAEFSFNNINYRLNISNEIMEKLGRLDENQDVEIKITSPENLESNCILTEIYI